MEMYNEMFVSIYTDTLRLHCAYFDVRCKLARCSNSLSFWTICIQVPVKAATKAAPAKKVESESDDEDDDEDEDDSEDEKVGIQDIFLVREVSSRNKMRIFLPLFATLILYSHVGLECDVEFFVLENS
jgi:hypothetical protein